MKYWYEEAARTYDPDEDVMENGGSWGMELASIIMKERARGLLKTSGAQLERSVELVEILQFNYDGFGGHVYGSNILVNNQFAQIPQKRNLLRQFGRTHLTGEDGTRVPIDQATDAQIGKAFQNHYQTYKSRKR